MQSVFSLSLQDPFLQFRLAFPTSRARKPLANVFVRRRGLFGELRRKASWRWEGTESGHTHSFRFTYGLHACFDRHFDTINSIRLLHLLTVTFFASDWPILYSLPAHGPRPWVGVVWLRAGLIGCVLHAFPFLAHCLAPSCLDLSVLIRL